MQLSDAATETWSREQREVDAAMNSNPASASYDDYMKAFAAANDKTYKGVGAPAKS